MKLESRSDQALASNSCGAPRQAFRLMEGEEPQTATYTLREVYVGCGLLRCQKRHSPYNLTSHLKRYLWEVRLVHTDIWPPASNKNVDVPI